MRKLIIVLTTLILLIFPTLASAQVTLPTWDYDSQRTATSQSSYSTDPWVIPANSGKALSYTSWPTIIYVPQLTEGYAKDPVTQVSPDPTMHTFSQFSSTTAVVTNGMTLYQYTWDDGGWGHVWEYTLQSGDLSTTTQKKIVLTQANLIKSFQCGGSGFQNGNWITNFADAPSGVTVSDNQNWMAVGAGNRLYWWPNGNIGAGQSIPINGNTNNDICSASPLITPN